MFQKLIQKFKALVHHLYAQTFNPSLLGVFVNPWFISRRNLWRVIRRYAGQMEGKLLDFGCGTKPYRPLFVNVSEYVGVDVASEYTYRNKHIDVTYDGNRLPFEDGLFDVVFSTQTLEHVPNVHVSLLEIHRVMVRGGTLMLTIPSIWGEHMMPYDYRRFTVNGIRQILDECGFETVIIEKLGNFSETIAQLIMDAITVKILYKRGIVNLLAPLLVVIPMICIAGLLMGKIERCFAGKKHSFYEDIFVLAKKK